MTYVCSKICVHTCTFFYPLCCYKYILLLTYIYNYNKENHKHGNFSILLSKLFQPQNNQFFIFKDLTQYIILNQLVYQNICENDDMSTQLWRKTIYYTGWKILEKGCFEWNNQCGMLGRVYYVEIFMNNRLLRAKWLLFFQLQPCF